MTKFGILVGSCFLVGSVVLCRADAPDCTADRHLDECGQNCPVTTTTVDPPTTTTTTLVDDPSVCPDPPPCQPVTCVCGDDGGVRTTINHIFVNRCPTVTFPKYAPCRLRKHGKHKANDVMFQGNYYKCPRFYAPQRFFVPLP